MTKFTDRQPPPLPPPEPLDEEERALARALHGLPSTMPPPELDARILGASRRAIAVAPKPRGNRGWVWGISTAAAAVLAVGVLMKMHLQGRDAAIAPPPEAPIAAEPVASPAVTDTAASADMQAAQPPTTTNAELKANEERAPGTTAPVAMDAAKSVNTVSEAGKQERDERQAAKPVAMAPSTFGTVAPQNASGSVAGSSAAARAATSKAAPQPFPATANAPASPAQAASAERKREAAPPEPPVVMDQARDISTPAPPPAPAAAAKSSARPTPIPPPPETAQMQASGSVTDARKDAALEGNTVGARTSTKESVILPPVDDDTKLSPTPWLARIRARVNAADGAGARESLRRFMARYPNAQIPADLAPLRK